jgi:hypothetical protein
MRIRAGIRVRIVGAWVWLGIALLLFSFGIRLLAVCRAAATGTVRLLGLRERLGPTSRGCQKPTQRNANPKPCRSPETHRKVPLSWVDIRNRKRHRGSDLRCGHRVLPSLAANLGSLLWHDDGIAWFQGDIQGIP